ncbi:Transcription factor FAMA [Panicum miliaceum]|uniref:Transcription factor FAMA n=1 Tax=Panicum miliaceum TaxID=4540 RepID=A0A3L6RC04_PANMI|nr:Transcription factor FAMA [Panicum miliaceum]
MDKETTDLLVCKRCSASQQGSHHSHLDSFAPLDDAAPGDQTGGGAEMVDYILGQAPPPAQPPPPQSQVSFDKLSFSDVLQFADFGPKLALNQPAASAGAHEGVDDPGDDDDGYFFRFQSLSSLPGGAGKHHADREGSKTTADDGGAHDGGGGVVSESTTLQHHQTQVPPAAAFFPPSLPFPVASSGGGDSGAAKILDLEAGGADAAAGLREEVAENKSCLADIEVRALGPDAMIKILSRRRPGQLIKTVAALEDMQMSILHTNITTIEQTVLYSFNVKLCAKTHETRGASH